MILKGVVYYVYNEILLVLDFSSQQSHYLCCRVKHFLVQTKAELHDALVNSKAEQIDCVVEVDNSIDSNANFHRFISKLDCFLHSVTIIFFHMYLHFYSFCRIMNMFSAYSTTRYLDYLLGVPCSKSELDAMPVIRIHGAEYMLYRYM